MSGDETRIKLKIDLKSGTIELDAPAESFDRAIEKTKELASTLDFASAREVLPGLASGFEVPEQQAQPSKPLAAIPARTRPRSGKSSSSARAGRIGSFDEISGLLTEEQEIELRSFMIEKAPSEQSDQTLVAIVKSEQLLGRKGFGFNEIYTLMWLSGVKDLPKALDVVLQRLIKDQMLVREDGGYAAKFVGRNRVERDLPTTPNS